MSVIGYREGFDLLDRDECMALLASRASGVGRLAIVEGTYPLILPVNYVVDQGCVVFRTAEGTKLDAAWRNAPVAFEVDSSDGYTRDGWSVLVRGRAEVVQSHDRIEELHAFGPRPWADGDRPVYVCIRPVTITGRRIHHVES